MQGFRSALVDERQGQGHTNHPVNTSRLRHRLTIVPILEPVIPTRFDNDDEELHRLVRASGGGNAAAFGELAGRVRSRVVAWAERFSGSADDADDIAQVVLLRLHQRAATFEGRSRFTSWLYRITWRVAADRKQLERRRAELLASHTIRENAPVSVESVESERLDAQHVAGIVREVAARLTPRQQQVLIRVDCDGASAADVANELGIADATVRVLLARARRAMRLRLLAEYPDLLEEYAE